MSTQTRTLLDRIAGLRQRLETDRGPTPEAEPPAEGEPVGLARLWELERQAAVGLDETRQINAAVGPPQGDGGETRLPARLTARARRVLDQGRQALLALREYHAEPLVHEPGGLLTALYRETTALTESALRTVASLPDSPAAQLQACDGVEALLSHAAHRLASLGHAVQRQRRERGRIDRFAEFLARLDAGQPVDANFVTELAETLLAEAGDCQPLRFHASPPASPDREWLARHVACHSLTVAQVMARLVRHDADLRGQAVEAVLCALLHDAGMVHLPPQLVAHPGPLDDAGKRTLEEHCRVGVHLVGRLMPGAPWLVEAAAHHHERHDGTGYPDGLRGGQLSPLVGLLAVCDVYSALCLARPHRPARETRTALTDTLLLAEQNKLDRRHAERLLLLSFYPVGSVVELADGSAAAVVATPVQRGDLHSPARPVIARLSDAEGRLLPSPHYLDLARGDGPGIVRALPPADRRRLLGARYPEWAI